MASLQLADHVTAAVQFLQALSGAQRDAAMASQFKTIKNLLSRVNGPVGALEAARCLTQVVEYMTEEQRSEMQQMVNERASAVPDPARGTHHWQDWSQDFWKDLPSALLNDLRNPNLSASDGMTKVFVYLATCGLRTPNEKVF